MADLARHMGWSVVYVSDIEHGRRNPPSPDKIRMIASYLDADAEELIDLANRAREKVTFDLKTGTEKQTEMALMLARSWDGLTEEEVEQINKILKEKSE
jgi:transcriptional regulator with XRE-family HTH domain